MIRLRFLGIVLCVLASIFGCSEEVPDQKRPNILFAISDDQSFPHTGFVGSGFINTPAFDRVAREGVYFSNCWAGSPGCAPSRSSIVTGRYHWQNEQSGQHASSWSKKYVPFIDLIEKNGYRTGRTGKGVGPFRYAEDGNDTILRKTDAAGIAYNQIEYGPEDDERPTDKMSAVNYFGNFKDFVDNTGKDKPFFFWYGGYEPHRAYEKGSWKQTEKKLEDAEVPEFLPDNEVVRGDLLDYAVEIEWFDLHLKRMLEYLEEIGELENTIVIVTSDNGMPFPRAKANSFEYGVHVPMAIRFPKNFPGGRIVEDPVSFVDLAPTLLELTETSSKDMLPISGKSILSILQSKEQGVVDSEKNYVLAGRERHSSSRYRNWGYPQRAIRDRDHLLIWNMKPERWPAGAPQKFDTSDTTRLSGMHGLDEGGKYLSQSAYTDIDDCPSKTFLIENHNTDSIQKYFDLAVQKRPEYELYDAVNDPYCLDNLAGRPTFSDVEDRLKKELVQVLRKTKDPRVVGPDKEVFDSYKRYSPMRKFPPPGGEDKYDSK